MILTAILAVSVLASIGLTVSWFSSTREVRRLQQMYASVQAINNSRAVLNALANDALEYSKRNPAINPILESAGIRQAAAGAPAPNQPRPAGR